MVPVKELNSELLRIVSILSEFFDKKSEAYDFEGRYDQWYVESSELLRLLESDNDFNFASALNFKYCGDGIGFGDWFMSASDAIKLGLMHGAVTLKTWQFEDMGWKRYFQSEYLSILTNRDEPRYFSKLPDDFRFVLDNGYFGVESLYSLMNSAWPEGHVIDHAFEYINTKDELVVVMQPYGGAVKYSVGDLKRKLNLRLHLYGAKATVERSEISEYSENAVTITLRVTLSSKMYDEFITNN